MPRAGVLAAAFVGGLAMLGAASGLATFSASSGVLTSSHLVGAFFVSVFLGAAFGTQLFRRNLGGSVLTGALCAASAMAAHFAAPFFLLPLVSDLLAPSLDILLMFLVVAPMAAGGMAAGGTIVLQQGVTRYREKHGLVHAPK